MYLEKYLKHNTMYMLYYKWFLKDFLNQDITVNEDYINSMAAETENINLNGEEEFRDNMTLQRKPFYTDTFIVHIRMDSINPGEILSVSKSCYSFTGYQQAELLRQKINKLMPKVIAESHDVILKQYISLGIRFRKEGKFDSFMQLKDNTLKHINLLVKLFYQVNGNIEMVGLMRECRVRFENPDYIVFENNGVRFCEALFIPLIFGSNAIVDKWNDQKPYR